MTLRTPEPFLGPFFFWSQMAQKWPMFPLAVSSRILFSMMGKNVGFCTQEGGQCVRNRVSNEMSLRLKRNVKNKNRSKTKQIQAENGINPSKKLSVHDFRSEEKFCCNFCSKRKKCRILVGFAIFALLASLSLEPHAESLFEQPQSLRNLQGVGVEKEICTKGTCPD